MIEKPKEYRRHRLFGEDVIEFSINNIFHKYRINIDTYHGGQINALRVRLIMADSEDIMHETFILLKCCIRGYVTDENIKYVCRTHAKPLS